ncbi:hypothetical protein GQ600_1170 [Phytophthora cactorum]|nr:hypothetical protein GQ600_1170 [Phytophthora cactorum]
MGSVCRSQVDGGGGWSPMLFSTFKLIMQSSMLLDTSMRRIIRTDLKTTQNYAQLCLKRQQRVVSAVVSFDMLSLRASSVNCKTERSFSAMKRIKRDFDLHRQRPPLLPPCLGSDCSETSCSNGWLVDQDHQPCHHEQMLSYGANCTRSVDACSWWQQLRHSPLKKDALIRAGKLPRCISCSAEAM